MPHLLSRLLTSWVSGSEATPAEGGARPADTAARGAGGRLSALFPSAGTGWARAGPKREVVPASPLARLPALARELFPPRLLRVTAPRQGLAARGQGNSRPPSRGAGCSRDRGAWARAPSARGAHVTAPPAGSPPARAASLRAPPAPGSDALWSACSMGKAAAQSRGGGCGGRSRGLSSLFTVVPCLSCHTAAPGMSAVTSASGLEPKPQPQPVPAPERESPEYLPRSDPGSETSPEPQTDSGQGTELLGLRPRSELGAGSFTRALAEQLTPLGLVVESKPFLKPESGLLQKPLPPPRSGQGKTPLGLPVSGTGLISNDPVASLPLDSYKGWLLKWTNYLKGYQRRWFVLGNGLLSYYR